MVQVNVSARTDAGFKILLATYLATFPGLLLEDRLRPFSDEITFLDLPYREALDAYLDWQQWINRRGVTF